MAPAPQAISGKGIAGTSRTRWKRQALSSDPLPPILDLLRDKGILASRDAATLRTLQVHGGKSTFLVEAGRQTIIAKITFPHWWQLEARIQAAMATLLPESVPAVLAELPEINGFAMAYVDPARSIPWGDAIRRGEFEDVQAETVGDLLGRMHLTTRGNSSLAALAAPNLERGQLKAQPLSHCIHQDRQMLPILQSTLADSLRRRTALAHGDISLNNVLVGAGVPVLIDFERAWYGDPAFDFGWMLGSLIERAVRTRRVAARDRLPRTIRAFRRGWLGHLDWESHSEAEDRAMRIALLRTIAGYQEAIVVHGKMPPARLAGEVAAIADLLRTAGLTVERLLETLAGSGFHAPPQ